MPIVVSCRFIPLGIALSLLTTADFASAQIADWERMRSIVPRTYDAARAPKPPVIDGKLDDAAWGQAAWTDPFVDIEGNAKPKPRLVTRAKMAWDDDAFYIAAELEEPHVWGTLTDHDAVIFQDNDFEVFVDPDGDNHAYAELELNVLNTTWDLFLPAPYKDGGKADNGYELAGLKTATHVDGTANDPSDTDRSWSVEIAIPWKAFGAAFPSASASAPRPNDRWRVNFSRVQWQHEIVDGKYRKVAGTKEDNWVWSPQGIIDMHRPERWGIVRFIADGTPPADKLDLPSDPIFIARETLMELYHRQKTFHGTHQRWAADLTELGMPIPADAADNDPRKTLTLRRTESGFRASVLASVPGQSPQRWSVDEKSHLVRSSTDNDVSRALDRAGDNAPRLRAALDQAPHDQRESIEFLIAHMPDRDLRSLSAEFLLENVRLAHEAFERTPWRRDIPWEIFANNVLPYASINERRDPWRKEFIDRFTPLIRDANSASQAAAILNQKVFPLVNVRYSTQRPRADQSPLESMKVGLASCTGLSVLLIDACRAVGIPARFVGTPLWADKSGNHSWVEVWDDGWHFTGAAEPSGDLLDQAWFVARARTALRDDPKHAIYAVSYQRTPLRFPMVWARDVDDVWAVNVTDRYLQAGEAPPAGTIPIMFVARTKTFASGPQGQDARDGQIARVAAVLRVVDESGQVVFESTTKDERFDANDHALAHLPEGKSYRAEFRRDGIDPTTIPFEAKPNSTLIEWLH